MSISILIYWHMKIGTPRKKTYFYNSGGAEFRPGQLDSQTALSSLSSPASCRNHSPRKVHSSQRLKILPRFETSFSFFFPLLSTFTPTQAQSTHSTLTRKLKTKAPRRNALHLSSSRWFWSLEGHREDRMLSSFYFKACNERSETFVVVAVVLF